MKKIFIGIDFSKETFDAALLKGSSVEEISYNKFTNDLKGCDQLLEWIKSMTNSPKKTWMLCGEHTGIYTHVLSYYLNSKGIDFWLEPAMQIKYSKGMCRTKNDKIDAKNIALYAYRFQDKAVCFKIKQPSIQALKDLMAYRERLLKAKMSLSVSCRELKRISASGSVSEYIYQDSMDEVETLRKKIKQVEKTVLGIIEADGDLKENYDLMLSVKGIGIINAVMILIATGNFTLFTEARKFACYCGVVPFEKQSGTSVMGKTKVSHLADKNLKRLLSQAARNAAKYDMVLKEYYQRKKQEGKTDRLIINNVRNKLVHRIFAIIKSKRKFIDDYVHPLQKMQGNADAC